MKVKRISENTIEVDGKEYIEKNSIDNSEWIKIPELGIEVQKEVHDKNKSFKELGLKDREKELLTVEQCIWLANSSYSKILKMDGSSTNDDFFIQQPLDLNKKNGFVAQFYSYSGRSYFDLGEDADGSGSDLGVRFVRKLKKK